MQKMYHCGKKSRPLYRGETDNKPKAFYGKLNSYKVSTVSKKFSKEQQVIYALLAMSALTTCVVASQQPNVEFRGTSGSAGGDIGKVNATKPHEVISGGGIAQVHSNPPQALPFGTF